MSFAGDFDYHLRTRTMALTWMDRHLHGQRRCEYPVKRPAGTVLSFDENGLRKNGRHDEPILKRPTFDECGKLATTYELHWRDDEQHDGMDLCTEHAP